MSALHTPYQPGILWNIKANEVLLEALKLSPKSDHNRRWMAQLEDENEALKSHSTLYEPFQLWCKYDPNQPRVPAGNSDGGQWTDGGTSGGGGSGTRIVSGHGRFGGGVALAKKPGTGPHAPDGSPVQLVQSRGGGRRGGGPIIRNIAGRNVEITPEQEFRLNETGRRADEAISRVRQRDPNWQPRPGAYEGVEGAIRYNEFRAREAGDRLKVLDFAAGQIFVPNGFRDGRHISEFRQDLRSSYARNGLKDVETYIRGSAVTGQSFSRNVPFDEKSDLDLAIVSPILFRRATNERWLIRPGGGRTFPLNDDQLGKVGLRKLRDALSSRIGGRKVSFMIYRSQDDIGYRGDYEIIDHYGLEPY